MNRKTVYLALTALSLAVALGLSLPSGLPGLPGEAAAGTENPCNPCGEKGKNPCNPCGGMGGNPCNPCGGKGRASGMPAVNPRHAKMGTVFYVADPMQRNTISFASRAPLEDIIGTSNQIRGYVVFDPENPKRGGRGELVVPTASLRTGIPLRDQHLAGADWLDAERHPEITFRIDDVNSVRLLKNQEGFRTYDLVVSGTFTLHGRTRNIEFPARITYLMESEQTRKKMPGDLLAGRASFELSLRDFGVKGFDGVVGSKVNDQISVDISFTATDHGGGTGNPCGGKAKNPRNPCGGKKKQS